jgi:hypothetical protein
MLFPISVQVFCFWHSVFTTYVFSVGFYQMSKIAVTPSIVLAEFLLYRKKVSFSKVSSFFFAMLMCTWKYCILIIQVLAG